MRESWTDERLDLLNQRVELGFEQVDQRFDELRTDMNRIHDRLDGLYRIMIQFCGATFAALITLVAAVLGLVAI